MSKPEIIAVTLSDGEQAIFVGGKAVYESFPSSRTPAAVELGQKLCDALGVELVHHERDVPDYEDWEWSDVYANLPDSLKKTASTQAVQLLRSSKIAGLPFGECIEVFAAAEDDPYVAKAREDIGSSDCIEIDAKTVISRSNNGAWVMAWHFISNEYAGVMCHSEVLEEVLEFAMKSIGTDRELDDMTLTLRYEQSDWLENLISNFADELDSIEDQTPVREPGPVVWKDEQGIPYEFLPSDAIEQLILLARRAGLDESVAKRAEDFCRDNGRKLDAMLTVVQTG